MYKTELIGYTPVAKKMAKKIEDKCNEMEKEGYNFHNNYTWCKGYFDF